MDIHEDGYGVESQIEVEEDLLSAANEKHRNESATTRNRAREFFE